MSTAYVETLDEKAQRKRIARMQLIDRMCPDTRKLVHEFGFHLVHSFQEAGVTTPNKIRHLIMETLREMRPELGTYTRQGPRVEVAYIAERDGPLR